MFENTRRTCNVLGAAAASTLCAGLVVVSGIVPQSEAEPRVQAAAAPLAVVPTLPEVAPTTVIEEVETPVTTAVPTTNEVVTTTTVPEVTTTTQRLAPPPPEPAPAIDVPAPAPVDPPPAEEPAAPRSTPRRVPTSAEVDQALEGLRPYVQTPFPIGAAQVAEAGDKVCTAFDEGKSVDEVKAEGMALVKKVPFTTVKPGADDYVVRTSIALYCPDHASKLA